MAKIKFGYLWLAASIVSFGPAIAHAKATPPKTRISMVQARKAATDAYAGQIKGEELEFEGGRWIYSFDMKKASDKDVHEVHIDAISGKFLNVHAESAADEKKEAKGEQSEAGQD
jgi:hypothetical protein